MKLPNWFKILWWIILLIFTGIILYTRYDAITTGQSVPADIFIFLIFIVLMLVPIFSEIELFGIKLKKEIENLKDDINIKFGDIKNEIRNSQTQTVNTTFQGFGPPPPDNKLPELENKILRIVNTKLQELGVQPETKLAGSIDVPDNNMLMFQVRYNIENELRKIYKQRFNKKDLDYKYRPNQSASIILQDLTRYGIIENNFFLILWDVLSICNYAIHGRSVTDDKVSFVRKNARRVIDYLKQVK